MIAPSGVVLDAAALRQMDVPLGTIARPVWRGRLHAFALPVAVPALVSLAVFVASSTRAVIGVGVYGLGLCSMFTASATYHRWVHTMRARELWRRTDHAMIYAAIAGSFTPICLLSLPDKWGLPLLAVMWIGGTASAAFKFAGWRHARLAGGVMYAVLSAVAGAAIPALWIRFGMLPAALMLVSGAFYGFGALGLNRRWPQLRPSVFGYHEVWHVNTVIAAAAHFAAVWLIIA
ncbi:MAG: hemolysin III family protein [Ilumatobacteraceae bacterium]